MQLKLITPAFVGGRLIGPGIVDWPNGVKPPATAKEVKEVAGPSSDGASSEKTSKGKTSS